MGREQSIYFGIVNRKGWKLQMKILTVSIIFFSFIVNYAVATLTWQTGQLDGNISDIDTDSVGWLVQMYRDVGDNTTLGQVTFSEDGSPSGAGNSSSDELLLSFTVSLKADNHGLSMFPFIFLI
jgi:hypothetical protein